MLYYVYILICRINRVTWVATCYILEGKYKYRITQRDDNNNMLYYNIIKYGIIYNIDVRKYERYITSRHVVAIEGVLHTPAWIS